MTNEEILKKIGGKISLSYGGRGAISHYHELNGYRGAYFNINDVKKMEIYHIDAGGEMFLKKFPNLESLTIVCKTTQDIFERYCCDYDYQPDIFDTSHLDMHEIGKLSGLISLSLTVATIDNINELKRLKKLKNLFIKFYNGSRLFNKNNINIISEMQTITELTLINLDLPNINVLTSNKNITKLEINSFSEINMSGIECLTNLETLSLVTPFTSDSDMSNIEKLKNLTNLNLENKNYSILGDGTYARNKEIQLGILRIVNKLHKLRSLVLNGWYIGNLDIIKDLTELENLNINTCTIRDISAVKSFTKLLDLKVHGTYLTNLKGVNSISFLHKLKGLELMSVRLKTIVFVKKLKELQRLNVFQNEIKTIIAIRNLDNLKEINIGRNPINDCSPLNGGCGFTRMTIY
jgi:internalin A